MVIAAIAMLVFGVMFLVLLYRLKSAFEDVARFAQMTWSSVENSRVDRIIPS
jgi:hypothetical protein